MLHHSLLANVKIVIFQPPFNDEKAASGFLGIKPTTRKEHMVRAILESIVYRTILTYDILKQQMNVDSKKIW